MEHGLTDSEKKKFNELREKLEGVKRADSTSTRRPVELGPIDPMLAEVFEGDLAELDESKWYAEQKFDGTRIILEKFDGEIGAYTRRAIERSATIPEVINEADVVVPDETILDCEFAYVDEDGRTHFIPIHGGREKIRERELKPRLFVFDILVADGSWVTDRSLTERKELLRETTDESELIRYVPFLESGFQRFFDKLVSAGEEGILLKRRASHYYLNTRSRHWRKVKAFTETDVIVVGFTPGEGRREDTFGALVMSDGEKYVGRVGSGFSEEELTEFRDSFDQAQSRPFPISKVGMEYTPVEPFVISVKYQNVTDNQELRAPVFLRRRHEKPINDVIPV